MCDELWDATGRCAYPCPEGVGEGAARRATNEGTGGDCGPETSRVTAATRCGEGGGATWPMTVADGLEAKPLLAAARAAAGGGAPFKNVTEVAVAAMSKSARSSTSGCALTGTGGSAKRQRSSSFT